MIRGQSAIMLVVIIFLWFLNPNTIEATENNDVKELDLITEESEGEIENTLDKSSERSDIEDSGEDSVEKVVESTEHPKEGSAEEMNNLQTEESLEEYEVSEKSKVEISEETSEDKKKMPRTQLKEGHSVQEGSQDFLLKRGDSNERVLELKVNLAQLGFVVSANPNTNYGPSTERVVKEFQEFYGLYINGVADETTLAKIEELINTPMQRGSYRKDVVDLKLKLATLGFVISSNPTPTYGPSTERVVKEFQKYYGLKETGVADEHTLAKVDGILSSALRKGQSHPDVIILKENLSKLGFVVSANPNTNYGPSTERVVKEFQKYYSLKENGIADERTLAKIDGILSSSLRKGQSHPDVIILKENLSKLGFVVSANPNTNYGPSTERVVKEFQEFYGLNINGVADEITLAKIEELINTPMQRGSYRKDVVYLKLKLATLGFVISSNPTPTYGPSTERTVKEFQVYYSLTETGVADKQTLAKIDEILSSALRKGQSHPDVIILKENLSKLGFVVSANPNTNYGPSTERVVKEFQKYYSLNENGIADERTLAKIDEILSSSLRKGQSHPDVIILKENLSKLGFVVSNNPNTNYGPSTERIVRNFQGHYNLRENGIADERTLAKIKNILSSPFQSGKKHKDTIQLKKDLMSLGFGSFNYLNTSYGPQTAESVKEFQKHYGLPISGIVDEVTFKKIRDIKNSNIRIFIDPGHGGKDPGASGYGLREKDVVLDIALRAAEILAKQYLGVEVKLSRTTDKFIELEDRAKLANDWGADYFVSVHTNAHKGDAHGFESFIHNGNVSNATKENQKKIHNYLIGELGVYDRGMKEANFSVLRNTTMPAILLEYLFIDNKEENDKLKKKSYRDFLGQITADAIAHTFNLKKR